MIADPAAGKGAGLGQLEQLRALHCGLTIGVAPVSEPALPGVDTPDDLRRAEAHWHALQG